MLSAWQCLDMTISSLQKLQAWHEQILQPAVLFMRHAGSHD